MIGRPSFLIVLNSVIGAALGYATLFVMARFMGDELVGARAYALSLVFLLGIVTRLGFPTTHARRLARQEDVPGSMGTYIAIKLSLTLLFIVLALTGAWIWFGILNRPATDLTESALWVGLWIVIVRSFFDIPVNTFRGTERIVEREVSLFVNTLTITVCTALAGIAYAWSHGRWSPLPAVSARIAEWFGATSPVSIAQGLTWLMAAFLMGHIATLVLSAAFFWRKPVPVGAPSVAIAKDYFHATLPIMVVTTAAILMRRTDLVMIGFWENNSAVGQYAAANKLSELVLVLAASVHVILMPVISRLHKEAEGEKMKKVIIDAERWISLLIWPLVIGGVLAARPVMHVVLSDHFLAAAPLFALLLFQALIMSLTFPLRSKALGLGEQKFAAKVAFQALGINIVLNLLLIPDGIGPVPGAGLGALGATFATIAAGLVFFVHYRIRVHKWTGHPYFSTHLRRHSLAALLVGGTMLVIMPILPELARFYDLLWFGLLISALYIGILKLMGEVNRDDLEAIRGVLRPKKGTEVDRS